VASEYVFIDEWDVDAPREAVFEALADARTYPQWWRPVYIAVEADCAPGVGCESRQEFKGQLPYHLKTRSKIVRYEPPGGFEVEVVGDLTGRGVWRSRASSPTPEQLRRHPRLRLPCRRGRAGQSAGGLTRPASAPGSAAGPRGEAIPSTRIAFRPRPSFSRPSVEVMSCPESSFTRSSR
jgi:hypothetical protein